METSASVNGVTAPLPGFGPVAPQERIETLDILRGFALFCILVVNWSVDVGWGAIQSSFRGEADRIAYWTIQFLLQEKAWPIFAFLFGLGFSIQMQRAEARGSRFVRVYARRLMILFLIGAAHYILTERDIVAKYAIVGILLLPLRKLNLNLLVVLALICVLTPWTQGTLSARDSQLLLANPQAAQQAAEAVARGRAPAAERNRTFASGTFGQIVSMRAREFKGEISSWNSYLGWLGDPFPPFLLGLYAGRRRIFQEVATQRQFIRKVMWWTLALGLAGNTIFWVLEF
ncbi:MAG TPA: heparan-alpha-glucosaminide N-acetyltransferase domain-containing protein, partial [Anaerolineales bacterium]